MVKDAAMTITNLSCSGCSPGKGPFGALTRFPLQSGWGLGAACPKYMCGHVPMWVTKMPSFSSISPTRAADLPHALQMVARLLEEVLDLIGPNPSPLSQEYSTTFV